jgi:hypothetical protein
LKIKELTISTDKKEVELLYSEKKKLKHLEGVAIRLCRTALVQQSRIINGWYTTLKVDLEVANTTTTKEVSNLPIDNEGDPNSTCKERQMSSKFTSHCQKQYYKEKREGHTCC